MTAGYTRERLGEITGLPVDRLAWLEELHVIAPGGDGLFALDSVERVMLVKYAGDRGVTDEQLIQFATEHADLLALLLEDSAGPTPAYPVAEAFERMGPLPVGDDVVDTLQQLIGLEEGEPVTEADIDAFRMATAVVELGFPLDGLMQMIRVYAEALERVADTENRVFHDYVHERFRAEGLSGRELYDATDALGSPMEGMTEPALLYFHQRAWTRARRDDFVRHLTEDTRPPKEQPGEARAAMLFIDLAGFTPLTLTMGDSVAVEVLQRFAAIVRNAAGKNRGRIVKQIGDAFMLVFDGPADAVRFGVDVCAEVERQSQFPSVHVGAHYGTFLYRDGDYVGNAVNVAARVASASESGQFLVTDELRAGAAEVSDATFNPLPPVALKGLHSPVALFEVRGGSGTETRLDVDPVCGMQLDAAHVQARASYDGIEFVFCSADCHDRFTDDPAKYA